MDASTKALRRAAALGAIVTVLFGAAGWVLVVGPRPSIGDMPQDTVQRLRTLGTQALASQDVPVGALITYRGVVIGEGHNTVLRDNDAGGHAEIRALSAAIAKHGLEGFAQLDKEDVVLYSTFEPCLMCRGALEIYGIENVEYLGKKDLPHLVAEELRAIRLLLTRRAREPSGLQEELFLMHPNYPRRPAPSR